MAKSRGQKTNAKRLAPPSAQKKENTTRFWHDPRFVIPTLIAIVSLVFNAVSIYPAFIDYLTRNQVEYQTSAEVVWEAEVQPLDYNPFASEMYRPGFFDTAVQLWVEITVKNTGNRSIDLEDLTRGMMLIPEWGNPTDHTDMLLRESGNLEQELEFTLPFYTYKVYQRPLVDVENEVRLPLSVAPDQTEVIYTPFTVPLSKNFNLMFGKESFFGPKTYVTAETVMADLILSFNNFGELSEWRRPGDVGWAIARKRNVVSVSYGEEIPGPDPFENLYPRYEFPLWVKTKFSDKSDPIKIPVQYQDPECPNPIRGCD